MAINTTKDCSQHKGDDYIMCFDNYFRYKGFVMHVATSFINVYTILCLPLNELFLFLQCTHMQYASHIQLFIVIVLT